MALKNWPFQAKFSERFRVPDLVPGVVAKRSGLRAIFIGESPHRDEVAPESAQDRSPFRGVAGREWWTELAKFLPTEIQTRPVPPRVVLEDLCETLQIVVMNAVQFPIDPKIILHQGELSNPSEQLGFEKSTGPLGYKAIFKKDGLKSPVGKAIADLAARLQSLGDSDAQLVCLGNDSRWFVEAAVASLDSGLPILTRPLITIPHPSAWWRNAAYRVRAVETLQSLLGKPGLRKSVGAEAKKRGVLKQGQLI